VKQRTLTEIARATFIREGKDMGMTRNEARLYARKKMTHGKVDVHV
jgi:hypothetical protein